jgi:hypothetical protein
MKRDAVIRVYDSDGIVIEPHEHKGFQTAVNKLAILPPFPANFPIWKQN